MRSKDRDIVFATTRVLPRGSVHTDLLLVLLACGCGGRTTLNDGGLQGAFVQSGGAPTILTMSMHSGGNRPVTGGGSGVGGTRSSATSTSSGGWSFAGASAAGGSPTRGGASPSGGASASGGAGGTRSTGGTRSMGGASATGGVPRTGGSTSTGGASSVFELEGDYDLFIDAPPAVAGCTPAFTEARVNLTIVGNGPSVGVYVYPDFMVRSYAGDSFELGASSLDFIMPPPGGLAFEDGPKFTLDLDQRGFSGTGTALITYICDDVSKMSWRVPAHVLPDRTPPKLRLRPMLPVSEQSALAFTEFRPEFSEFVGFRDGTRNTLFYDLDEAAAAVTVVDSADGRVLDLDWAMGIAGGETVLALQNYQDWTMHRILPRLLPTELADRSGNRAVVFEAPWLMLPSATIGDVLDLDSTPLTGLYGTAIYQEAASGSADCESGGCLVIDGTLSSVYSGFSGSSQGLFALNFASPFETKYTIRYQLWATQSDAFLMTLYPTGCTGWFSGNPLTPMATPAGGYTLQTGWVTAKAVIGPCAGPERDRGIALVVGCEWCDPSDPSIRAKLVIERIEAAAP